MHSANEIAVAAAALNSRPRKTLDWKTPAEALDRFLQSADKDRVAPTASNPPNTPSVAFGARCKEPLAFVHRQVWSATPTTMRCAQAEFLRHSLECELIDRRRFRSHSEARMAVFQFIEGFYNPSRRHSALGVSFARRIRKEARWPKQARLSPNPSITAGQLQRHRGSGQAPGGGSPTPPQVRPRYRDHLD